MKKVLLFAVVALTSSVLANAQDFAKATELAKSASEALNNEKYAEAVEGFKNAITEAASCTVDGTAEFINTCKTGVTQAIYSGANKLVKDGKLEEAMDALGETIKVAGEYGVDDIKEKAVTLKQQVVKLYANNQIKAAAAAATAEEKVACFNKALEKIDLLIAEGSADFNTYIQKGQVLRSLGKTEEAVQAFLTAKEMGAGDAADKQIAKIYVLEANGNLKAKKYAEAVASAKKALEYEATNATACKIAGTAANANKDPKTALEYLNKYLEINPTAKDAAQIKAAVDALSAQLAQQK